MKVGSLALVLILGACAPDGDGGGDVGGGGRSGARQDAGADGGESAPGLTSHRLAAGEGGEESEASLGMVPAEATLAGFVGRESCAECHSEQVERFTDSHHDLAMQPADESTVLGDFADASYTHFDTTSRFFRRDGGFWVATDGPDGKLHEYSVAYTFGVFPLQQYMVLFPGGRLQVLPLCWDSRLSSAGGQRWFHLYPDEAIVAGDVLHWTGPNQNWNYQCAECHSTGLVKNYREASDDYATTWTEIDVSCEACHGPGEEHLAWARQEHPEGPDMGLAVTLKDESLGLWEFLDDTGIATRSTPRSSRAQSETCARCHGRRSLIEQRHRFDRPLLDNQLPSLIDEGLYYPDGQPLEEVYVHGSFLQSPMHQAGVTCSDCHDPHALTVRGQGNTMCAGCHEPQAFDRVEHHHHEQGGEGAACVACHMPSTTYMVVDERSEHRFSVPRPDLSGELGTPNACTTCHEAEPASWAAAAALEWWGDGRRETRHHGQVLAAARRHDLGAERALSRLVADDDAADMVRATALVLLAEFPGAVSSETVVTAGHGGPLLRLAAARAGEVLPAEERWAALAPLLGDELLAVAIEAARALAGVPLQGGEPEQPEQLELMLEEYRRVQRLTAERPESQLSLGLLAARLGDWATAEAAYLNGARLGPDFQPLPINLADLYRLLDRDEEGLAVLQAAQQRAPQSPSLNHARGLALVRLGRYDEALPPLELAALAAPEDSRFSYVWAVALASLGDLDRAIEVLSGASADHPFERELLYALVSYQAQAGAVDEAQATVRRLLALDPDDPTTLQLLRRIQGQPAEDG